MRICSYCGRENEAALEACSQCGTPLTGTDESVPSGPAKPKVACPACGAPDNYRTGIALRGSFSWLIFFLGGFLAVLFRNASRQRRVQCNVCGVLFGIRTPLSKVSLVIFWLLMAPTIIVLLYALFGGLFSR
jgi:DNA-directed RNA polymerase subunit RPC12/RpoP